MEKAGLVLYILLLGCAPGVFAQEPLVPASQQEKVLQQHRDFIEGDFSQQDQWQQQLKQIKDNRSLPDTATSRYIDYKSQKGLIGSDQESKAGASRDISSSRDWTSASPSLQQQLVQVASLHAGGAEEQSVNKTLYPSETEQQPGGGRYIAGPSQYDSRIEPRILDPLDPLEARIRNSSLSVGVIIEKDKLHLVAPGKYQIDLAATLASHYNLCPGQPFASQPVVGVGTAFITGDRQLLTAGHVFSRPVKDYVVLFGYEITTKDQFEDMIDAQDIYYPEALLQYDQDLDISLFTVDRPLGRPALQLAQSTPAINTPVYMIGYPSGLPQKVALNAEVTDNKAQHYCYTSLDAFQGNSGSPVFRMDNHEVVGVLVSGQTDYTWTGSCYTTTLCRKPYCEGEKMMNSTAILDAIAMP